MILLKTPLVVPSDIAQRSSPGSEITLHEYSGMQIGGFGVKGFIVNVALGF